MTKDAQSKAAQKIHFRAATAADRTQLIALVNAAFSIETFLDGTRTDDVRLAAMMEKGTILTAEDGTGRLLASIYMEQRGRRGYLGMLAVDPARQCEGLSRRLVEAAEQRFRDQGCEGVDITVLNLRPELPRIYQRYGYSETGTEEFKPTQPLRPSKECRGIVMSKQL
jgi:ribosomal protein S18 acetylase RimI-like enzyme